MLKKCLFIFLVFPINAYGAISRHNFKMGIEYADYTYRETGRARNIISKKIMSLKGPFFGANLSYSYNYDKYFFDIDGRLLVGVTKYNGHLMNGTPYRFKNTLNVLFEPRVLPGIKFGGISVYTGLGYRFKGDASVNVHSYPRRSQYLYTPLGVKILSGECYHNDIYLSVTPYIEYDFFIKGLQTGSGLRLRQNKGYGAKAGITCKIDPFEITPYINYWNISASKSAYSSSNGFYWYEPKNTTTEIGIKLSATF